MLNCTSISVVSWSVSQAASLRHRQPVISYTLGTHRTSTANCLRRLELTLDYIEYFSYWDSFNYVEPMQTFLASNEAPLLERLSSSEFVCTSIWKDLANPRNENLKAILSSIDQLLLWFDDPKIHPRIMEGLVSFFSHKPVAKERNLYNELRHRYLAVPPSIQINTPICRGLDRAFANALAAHSNQENLPDLRSLLKMTFLGESRILLLMPFNKFRKVEFAKEVLLELQNDRELENEVRKILRKTS